MAVAQAQQPSLEGAVVMAAHGALPAQLEPLGPAALEEEALAPVGAQFLAMEISLGSQQVLV